MLILVETKHQSPGVLATHTRVCIIVFTTSTWYLYADGFNYSQTVVQLNQSDECYTYLKTAVKRLHPPCEPNSSKHFYTQLGTNSNIPLSRLYKILLESVSLSIGILN